MSVFSKFKSFLGRHRNKFYLSGLIITGSLLALKYAQKQLRGCHEKEAKEFIERNRKLSHFDSINRTCNQTALNLSSTLLENICTTIDIDKTVNSLNQNSGNKLEMWNTLKVQVFMKAGTIIYSLVMLVITIKLQLNIVGSYLYKDPTSVSAILQEKYLSLCQNFLNEGIEKLANMLKLKFDNILSGVDLKKEMIISDIQTIFWSIQASLNSDMDGPINQFKNYVINTKLSESSDIYSNMLRDTADLLESEEVTSLATHLINCGFTLLVDQLFEFFVTGVSETSDTGNFVNHSQIKKPLAKIIPVLNRLLSKQALPQNLLQDILVSDRLQALCANVYESL
ncbi:peroxisomal biogenesis factor 3 [Rhynchophorus ferrugineus]|uniref:Peroxisomal biogenesis factor 3 n=1 Tax=Rhynchophorus ferrugineus TaxID=354439 RepID=A0A834MJS6_RHYFE|nr:hypothetical protein GWI33_005223 [Rhynchophorus ferrugineus]